MRKNGSYKSICFPNFWWFSQFPNVNCHCWDGSLVRWLNPEPKFRAFHSSEPSWERLIFVKYDKTAAYDNHEKVCSFLIDISKPQIADAIKLTDTLQSPDFFFNQLAMVEATTICWLIFFLWRPQDLDAVRATKATKMVQGHVDRLQETMHLAQVGDLEMA